MTRRKQQRPIQLEKPKESASSLQNADRLANFPLRNTVMNGQEGNCSMEQANGDDISDPSDLPADTTSLPPNVHCARIRTLQKSIRQLNPIYSFNKS
ncbi:hypothetical protein TNCT_427161 [Trichonephila clavata]|uniref:Uncharacterized protein n=1 Tax=Trichonephila clavata TaxID=2740835 RepID=A0A8X6LYS3_TRICU|nr:hypothetical protein TNCT_427161 [Trichonephila clavata]